MDYEKKYTESLERAKKVIKECGDNHGRIKMIEQIFPELKESENEKIRKALIRNLTNQHSSNFPTVDGFTREQILSWLEKQGEKTDYNPYKATVESISAMIEKYANDGDLEDFYDNVAVKCHDAMEYDNIWLEKQGEQKPSDKVESKFKVGDFIQIEHGNTTKVLEVSGSTYRIVNCHGFESIRLISDIDSVSHLWTIQDAKDGDVLVANETIFIFKNIRHNMPYSYGGIDCTARFRNCIDEGGKDGRNWTTSLQDIYPATKEQRDTLFAKIKEAGYKWDAEKKKLKKIEHNLAWSEEDEKILDEIIDEYETRAYNAAEESYLKDDCWDKAKWLKSLKEKIQQKQELNNEDIKIIKMIEDCLSFYKMTHCATLPSVETCIDWLKSLKPNHWKPSEEQLNEVKEAIGITGTNGIVLLSLYNDLKKL